MRAANLRHGGVLVAVTAVTLAATACGSSSKSAATGGAATAAGTTSAAAAAATSGTSAAAPAATTGASAMAATSTAAPAPAPTSAAPTTKIKATGGGSWCKNTADTLNKEASLNPGTTPAALKSLIQTELGIATQIAASAPKAIKPDVEVVFGAVIKLYQTLEKDNYDFTKLTPADEAVFDDPTIKAAETRIEAYVKGTCGIDLGIDASASAG